MIKKSNSIKDSDESCGTQVTDIAKKVDYGKLVRPFRQHKKVEESVDIKRDANIEPGSDEEFMLDSLYDKVIGGYVCTECGKTIKNITDFNKKSFKDFGVEYYCPYCGEPYTPQDLNAICFYETDISVQDLKDLKNK